MTKNSTKLGSIFAPARIGKGGRSLGYVGSCRTMRLLWFRGGGTTSSGLRSTLPTQTAIASVRGNLPLVAGLSAGVLFLSRSESEHPSRSQARRRERELRWLRTHREDLRKFAGQWIVIESEEIVARGPDAAEVVREARSKGVRVPFVYRVEGSRPKGVVYMGL